VKIACVKILLLGALLSIGSVSCESQDLRRDIDISFIAPNGLASEVFHSQIAKTENERSRGLMYRRSIEDNEGMLFIFQGMEERSFWMKNTYIPLDMIFIDDKGVVKTILENVPPLTSTARKSKVPVKYVFEVKGGKARKSGIQEGFLMKGDPADLIPFAK